MSVAAITACPGCGTRSSEDYDGRGSCWTCFSREHGIAPAPARRGNVEAWVEFRRRIIRALEPFHYIDKNTAASVCPICDDSLGVRFKGQRPAADLTCHGGCPERELAATLRKAR